MAESERAFAGLDQAHPDAEGELIAAFSRLPKDAPTDDLAPALTRYAQALFDAEAARQVRSGAFSNVLKLEAALHGIIPEIIERIMPERSLFQLKAGEPYPADVGPLRFYEDGLILEEVGDKVRLAPRRIQLVHDPHGVLEYALLRAGLTFKLFPDEKQALRRTLSVHLGRCVSYWAGQLVPLEAGEKRTPLSDAEQEVHDYLGSVIPNIFHTLTDKMIRDQFGSRVQKQFTIDGDEALRKVLGRIRRKRGYPSSSTLKKKFRGEAR